MFLIFRKELKALFIMKIRILDSILLIFVIISWWKFAFIFPSDCVPLIIMVAGQGASGLFTWFSRPLYTLYLFFMVPLFPLPGMFSSLFSLSYLLFPLSDYSSIILTVGDASLISNLAQISLTQIIITPCTSALGHLLQLKFTFTCVTFKTWYILIIFQVDSSKPIWEKTLSIFPPSLHPQALGEYAAWSRCSINCFGTSTSRSLLISIWLPMRWAEHTLLFTLFPFDWWWNWGSKTSVSCYSLYE